MMRFQVFLSLWSVASCLCIDEITEVAKTKVSKPKRYSLSKLGLCHALLKRLIQTRPHVYVTMCKYLHNAAQMFSKERRCGFSNCSSVDAAVTGRSCVSMQKQKNFIWPSESMNLGIIKITYNNSATQMLSQQILWTTAS